MRIGLMVEGQNGLTWERWLHILQLAERLEFPSVFRSDHFFIGKPQSSIEAYLSFAVAARETSTIRFGPLVTPVTFRTPVDVARMAAQVDLLSGGRFVMGVGAGWNEAEHRAYGIPFPPVAERFERLEEAIRLTRGLWNESPASFDGTHYRLEGADLLPKPATGRPPLLIGGTGERTTLRLVARYADEWNSTNLAPEAYREKVSVLQRHCEAEQRDPSEIQRSMMVFGIIGPDEASVSSATERMRPMLGAAAAGRSVAEIRSSLQSRGMIAGSTDEVVHQLAALAELGVQEVQFQHMNFDSDLIPEYLAAEIAPRVRDL